MTGLNPRDPEQATSPTVASTGSHTSELTMLPRTAMTLDEARSKLSGLHFSKESLSNHEREILYIAEGLLRLIDEASPTGYAR